MTGQPDYRTAQFLRDLDHFARAWRLLDDGDLAGVQQVLEAAPKELRNVAEFHHILAATLAAAGQLEQAAVSADAYAERRPESFDGIELASRIHTTLNQPASNEALLRLARRRAELVVRTLEGVILRCGADWRVVVATVIASTELSNGFKARILAFLFDHLLDPEETAAVAESLVAGVEDLAPAHRVMVAGTLLVHCGRTAEALSLLEGLIEAGGLTQADFPAVLVAVNQRVGWGDAVAHRDRYRFLTLLYAAWTALLDQQLSADQRAALARIRPGAVGSKRVAILTPPLLSTHHAPTNRVLEIAVSLQRDFGHTVMIFAGGALQFRAGGGMPAVTYSSVNAGLLRVTSFIHDSVELPTWGTFLDDGQRFKFPTVALEIARFEPEVVLCYGDASPVQALLAGRIPVVVFPSNSTPPVGPADRYVSLWDEEALRVRVARGAWPADVADKAVFGSAGVRYPKPARRVARQDLVADAGLLLAIVGTRIAGEIRGDFARRLAAFMDERPEIHLLTIGDPNRENVLGAELACVAERVHTRGLEAELANLLTGCDIVLNPDRQGGGTGVAMAMAAGCPVVALGHGDGATLLETDDLSLDLDSYFERLADLADNPARRSEVAARMPDRVETVLGFERGMASLVEVLRETASQARSPGT